jgi:indolepyruvate ferredoxin oxidoreductase beta subunit
MPSKLTPWGRIRVEHFNIIICGVGGTGAIGLSEILKKAALIEGNKVLASESRGSGQRGGPTTASVRIAALQKDGANSERTALWSGLVGIGGADLMLATEVAEALRNAHYLSENSNVILNAFKIMPKQTRKEIKAESFKYPSVEEVVEKLHQLTSNVHVSNASELSMRNFGSYRLTNPIMVGQALALGVLPLKIDTVKNLLQGKAKDALKLGYNFGDRRHNLEIQRMD